MKVRGNVIEPSRRRFPWSNRTEPSSRWWNGPDFLWKTLEDRPCPDGSEAIYFPPGVPEVNRITAMTTQTLEPFSLPKRIEYFSCWHRAKRAVAVCLRLQKKFRTRMENQNTRANEYIPVNTQELQNAERKIVKSVQREAFQEKQTCFAPTLKGFPRIAPHGRS